MDDEMEAQVGSLILGSLEVNEAKSVIADLGSLNIFTTEVDTYKSHGFDKMLSLLLLSGGAGKAEQGGHGADRERVLVHVRRGLLGDRLSREVQGPRA